MGEGHRVWVGVTDDKSLSDVEPSTTSYERSVEGFDAAAVWSLTSFDRIDREEGLVVLRFSDNDHDMDISSGPVVDENDISCSQETRGNPLDRSPGIVALGHILDVGDRCPDDIGTRDLMVGQSSQSPHTTRKETACARRLPSEVVQFDGFCSVGWGDDDVGVEILMVPGGAWGVRLGDRGKSFSWVHV